MKFRFSHKKNKGVAAIEFAIGFMFFFYMIAAWVEMSFMSYVSGIGDLAISRAAQVAKKYEGNQQDGFKKIFEATLKQDGSLWKYVTSLGNFTMSVNYVISFSNLHEYDASCDLSDPTTKCAYTDSPTDAAIAVYSLSYDYKPVFNLYVDGKTVFSREMIVIQEYQRDKF